jgi:hypothetical protein
MEAIRGKRANLVPPRIPGLGKAMGQQHQRPLALLGDVETDAVAFDNSLLWFVHLFLMLKCGCYGSPPPIVVYSLSYSDQADA